MGIQYRHRGLAIAPGSKLASDTQACQGGKKKGRQGRQTSTHTLLHMHLHMQYFSQCTMMKPGLNIDKIHGRGVKLACATDSRTGAAGA